MRFLNLLLMFGFFFFTLLSTGETAELAPLQIKSIQADFTQEKHLKILTHPIISTGTFTFEAPQALRWEYQTPIKSLLLMYSGKIKKYRERNGQLIEDKGMQLDSMRIVLGEISNWLEGRFSDNGMFTVSHTTERVIQLVPKEKGLSALISMIELRLAEQNGLLDGISIIEGADSYTTLTFTSRVLNQDIPASVFTQQ